MGRGGGQACQAEDLLEMRFMLMVDFDDVPEEELKQAIRKGELQAALIQWLTLNNIKWFRGQLLREDTWVPFSEVKA